MPNESALHSSLLCMGAALQIMALISTHRTLVFLCAVFIHTHLRLRVPRHCFVHRCGRFVPPQHQAALAALRHVRRRRGLPPLGRSFAAPPGHPHPPGRVRQAVRVQQCRCIGCLRWLGSACGLPIFFSICLDGISLSIFLKFNFQKDPASSARNSIV